MYMMIMWLHEDILSTKYNFELLTTWLKLNILINVKNILKRTKLFNIMQLCESKKSDRQWTTGSKYVT